MNVLTKHRSQTIENAEHLLLIWMNQKQLSDNSVSEGIIYKKFSTCWIEKFNRHIGHTMLLVVNVWVRTSLVSEKDYVETEGFLSQQVFNSDKTVFFWKEMPNRMVNAREEMARPGYNLMKYDVFSCVVLLVDSDISRVFNKSTEIKSKFCVM